MRVASCALTFLLVAAPALAVGQDKTAYWAVQSVPELRDLTTVNLVIEDISKEAAKCHVTTEGLRLAASRPLVDGGLHIGKEFTGASLHLSAVIIDTNTGCVAHMGVELYENTLYVPSSSQDLRALGGIMLMEPRWGGDLADGPLIAHHATVADGHVQLLSMGNLLTGPYSGFAERIYDTVRRVTDDFVTQIKIANQK